MLGLVSETFLSWMWLAAAGFGFGFISAAPIGAVNIICIRRTLQFGPLNGFLSGTGAALGDGFFAMLVAFGFTSLSTFLTNNRFVLELTGGLILVSYAIYALLTTPQIRKIEAKGEKLETKIEESSAGFLTSAFSTFGLTIINPATLFFFAAGTASVANLMTVTQPAYLGPAIFVGAVVAGSLFWWAVIVGITAFAHKQIGDKSIVVINRITGILIGLFGIIVLFNLFSGHILF